ncbi:hypothetical protein K2173_023978 [Erythroxylum novogranatense]|uniref:Uncharacterized protein n=1 Tax=Erythroxylum novogranatense TaxID=1862640 RepID=A0AAV8TS18_9ROSI|nr:hypothetical protein K2173_023978 [Erythroxylum novogranatense]
MSKKGNKQNKVILTTIAPVRVFINKAKKFYMKSLMNFASKVGHGNGFVGGPVVQNNHVPISFCATSSRRRDDNEFQELLRLASRRRTEAELEVRQGQGVKAATVGSYGNGMRRSYTVGVGKIGKIDEDRACSFREIESVKEKLYSRSRSIVGVRK